MALTKKRRLFVEEYLRCWNGAEAARRAGYSPRSAYSTSYRLLRIPQVEALVERRMSELEAKDNREVADSLERKQSSFVYLFGAENGLTKIGKTIDIQARFNVINNMSPIDLFIIDVVETDDADALEQSLHERFAHRRVKGEWFDLSDDEILDIGEQWAG